MFGFKRQAFNRMHLLRAMMAVIRTETSANLYGVDNSVTSRR